MKRAVCRLAPMLCALLLILSGCVRQVEETPAPTPSPPQDPAETPAASPDMPGQSGEDGVLASFTAETIDGETADAGIFSGYELTMVNVWATFCGPCIREMPDLAALHAEYADRGFQIVGIVADVVDLDGNFMPDMVDTAVEIIEATGADYLHLLPSDSLQEALLKNAVYVPTTIFVDQQGKQVGDMLVGSRSREEWTEIIDGLLGTVQ